MESRWHGTTDFRVLGPLEVSVGGHPVVVRAAKQRVVLASLLLAADRTVSIEELAENLWDGRAPVRVRATVQKYVMRVRRALGASECAIRTEPDGYRLELRGCALDLRRFAELADEGSRAAQAGEHRTASARLEQAQRLWRAVPPLSNVDSTALARNELARLTERYLQVCEARMEVDLSLGRHSGVGEELIGLVRAHPFRERLWLLRIRALHGEGRQGEALAVFREVSELLRDELGVDPGPALRAAHEEVLKEPGPTPKGRDRPGPVLNHPVRQLPMATCQVLGRTAEVEQVVRALAVPAVGSPRVVLLTGDAGIGKTTVALAAAHRLAGSFPDGQLYASLAECPAEAGQCRTTTLARFLSALGVRPEQQPSGAEDAAALYRSLTAGRRFLVVLDGARSTRQVRTLLPGSSGSGVLVTSRLAMRGLLMDPGARVLNLARLPADDARNLLEVLIGRARPAAEPAATDRLIGLCDGRPLALRAAAAYLATRSDVSVRVFVRHLAAAGVPVDDATWELLCDDDRAVSGEAHGADEPVAGATPPASGSPSS